METPHMRAVIDIESTGLLNTSSIDYTKIPYKLKPTFKIHCIVVKDIDSGAFFKFYADSLEDFVEFSKCFTTLILHNGINYDLRVLQLYFGLDYKITSRADYFDGREVTIIDSLILSKLLNPDRGGHSLKWWGNKLGFLKGNITVDEEGEDIPEVWDEFSLLMLEYCVRDVELTHKVYDYLTAEAFGSDWRQAHRLEKFVAYYISLYSHYGFKFDSNLAMDNLDELNVWIAEIEERVEKRLPTCKMNIGESSDFIPPKIQFKKNKELSANMLKFLAKHGGEAIGPMEISIFGRTWNLPLPLEPMVTEKQMTLKDQIKLKQWLCSLGWIATVWKDRDLTCKSGTKHKVDQETFHKAYEKWRERIVNTPYEPLILDELEVGSLAELDFKAKNHEVRRPFKVPTNPSYVKNQEKEICDNLLLLGQKVDFVADIVKYLTYKHRRSSISGSDEEKGWLNNPRLRVDGRLPTPADTVGTNTYRFRHIDVCNIPRVTSLYGENIRGMFCVDDYQYQIGYDGSGLEARVQGHFIYNYKGGPEFAQLLLQGKPNDIHTVTAKNLGIPRDIAKNIRYALMYGATWGKIKKMLGCSPDRAQKLYDDFWNDSLPLKLLKEHYEKFWNDKNKGNKKFIEGIDGRRLSTRSKHSLINALFQSTGVIAMKRAMVYHFEWMEEEGLLGNPFNEDILSKPCALQMIAYHDEAQIAVHKELVEFKKFSSKEEAEEFRDGRIWTSPQEFKGSWWRTYSRVGELATLAVRKAGEFYNLNVALDSEYVVGLNWAMCH
jgi:hypothetical protein